MPTALLGTDNEDELPTFNTDSLDSYFGYFVQFSGCTRREPKNLIATALREYQALNPYRAEVLREYQNASTKTTTQVHRTIISGGPRKLYIEQFAPFHLFTIVDGTNIWRYSPESMTYFKWPYDPNVEPIEISTLQHLASFAVVDAEVLPDGNVGAHSCTVVRARFRSPKTNNVIVVTLWIDKVQYGIRKMVSIGNSGQAVTTTILNLTIAT